jgi:hypothetical protein
VVLKIPNVYFLSDSIALISGTVAFQMVDFSIITYALFRFWLLTNTFSPSGENASNSTSKIATVALPLFA